MILLFFDILKQMNVFIFIFSHFISFLVRMESAFRTWLREKKEGQRPQFWDDLTRELQMALGTAKWQVSSCSATVEM